METAVISLMCIALVVFGGMTMSRGFLTSADYTAHGVEEISVRDGEIMRTGLDESGATGLSWANTQRAIVENTGQTKLAGFSKWDVIVQYYDGGGTYYVKWLPYTEGALGDNEWQRTAIYLNGQPEVFEPGILNPGEEMLIDAKLSPSPQQGTNANVIIASPNGVQDSLALTADYPILTPHSENTAMAGTQYYRLREGTPADGTAVTMTTDVFLKNDAARNILYNEDAAGRPARHIFPLTGISQIPAATWTVYYRCRTWGEPNFPWHNNDVNFDIDILVRQSDGTIRTTIATNAADAYLTIDEVETWLTKSATYDFPGYTVVDDSDYLEIVYYGECDSKGAPLNSGYMQIRIDDSTLAAADQTRIES